MKHITSIFAALLLVAAPASAQTLKSLMYNTTNGVVAYSSTNTLTFTNNVTFIEGTFNGAVTFNNDVYGSFFEAATGTNFVYFSSGGIGFGGVTAANTRTNLGLGATNRAFAELGGSDTNIALNLDNGEFFGLWTFDSLVSFTGGFSVSGNLTINQNTATNGLLYIYRTNAEPFLGLANLIASNNVTVSNETLFRVGVSETNNRAAQFGFRSTNTNGNGVAVFSVYGYNALMMIGPSDPNAGTNPIQATVYSISPTNKVMTLIATNTGAMQMHRPIAIDTAGVSTNAPANATNVAGWIQFYVGTNSVRVPYYQ